MIAILAKDYNQFIDYLTVNFLKEDYPGGLDKDYMYASSAQVLLGVKLDDYIIVGNFHEREDSIEILTQANYSKMQPKESKVSDTKALPIMERSIIRGITLITFLLLSSIVFGIGTCIQFDRQMERLCMERGGSWNGVVGCYQPMPAPSNDD